MLAVLPQPHLPASARADEDLSRVVHVRVVDDAVGHAGCADVEAVGLGEIHDLVGVLGHAGTDEGVARLTDGSGESDINEGFRVGHELVGLDDAATDVVNVDDQVGRWLEEGVPCHGPTSLCEMR